MLAVRGLGEKREVFGGRVSLARIQCFGGIKIVKIGSLADYL